MDEEMRLDQDRLWLRNLSRDDKIVSSNQKELRFPFLNRDLIQFSQKLDKNWMLGFQEKAETQKLNGKKEKQETDNPNFRDLIFDLCQFQGDFKSKKRTNFYYNKLILRALAHQFGLVKFARLGKKAMQFGTGLAKMVNISNLLDFVEVLRLRFFS